MTDKPWTQPGLTAAERAKTILQGLGMDEATYRLAGIREALDAHAADAVRQATQWTRGEKPAYGKVGDYLVIIHRVGSYGYYEEGTFAAVRHFDGFKWSGMTLDHGDRVIYHQAEPIAPPTEATP